MAKPISKTNGRRKIPTALPALDSAMKNLRAWNLGLALLHAAQASAILWLSADFRLPLTSAFLAYSDFNQQLEPYLNAFGELRIGPLVAGWLFLSALAHLLVALPTFHDWYLKNIARGINPARWIEYSLSAGLMLLVIAMLSGIYDITTLLAVVGLSAMMVLFGWMMELHNQTTKRPDWTSFTFGAVTGLIPWLIIGISLIGAGMGTAVPAGVWWISVSTFVLFVCLVLNMFLQYKKIGPWQDYVYGEKTYFALSLMAKSALAWQVFAVALRPG